MGGLSFIIAALIVASAAGAFTAGSARSQQPEVALAIDADPADNTATSIGAVNACRSVASGDSFDVDIIIEDVTDLLAWEITITYDPDLLEVTVSDVTQFQAANEGSDILDISDDLPDTDGRYVVSAADTAEPPAPDSGSGVLARLTMSAKSPGASPLTIAKIDINNDGAFDRGPLLRDVAGEIIGDEDDDTFFDGSISNAEVRIDEKCGGPPIEASPTAAADDSEGGDDDGDGVSVGVVIGAVAGGLALLVVAGGLIALFRRRRRATGP
ncbi:MAG: hypothetical protein HY334_08850 [Armatimonadetes bacterium]|nr:hypothetical protein [Armatimonadota bacterium]